jgi:hypothetical protein
MSYQDGISAIHLEMPERVPRTEYSVTEHWKLVTKVTGIQVDAFSDDATKKKASSRFMREWNFDFNWNILINSREFGDTRTKMGHAQYAQAGTDFDADISQLFQDPEDVFSLDPFELLGTCDIADVTKRFDADYLAQTSANPDMVNMTGIYVTCMSGLIDLLGWDTLLSAAGLDPTAFGELTNRYASWIERYFIALAQSLAPTVMVHDDIVWTSGAFIAPAFYRKFIFPNYKKFFAPLLEAGKKIIYTSDGNYTEFIDDIAGSGVSGFVMEPTTDMAQIADKYGKTHVFIGNADTRILLSGSKEEIYAEVKRCMDIGKQYPGFFMAVGNHIPANTPIDNALYYNEVYEKLSRR